MSEPSSDAVLRERIAEALRTTPTTGHAHEPGQERFDHHPKPGERGHRYTYTCALCRNDVDALADALLPVVAEHVAAEHVAAETARLRPGHAEESLNRPCSCGACDLRRRVHDTIAVRFENDGHPEDAQAAADEAMSVVQPEMDQLRAERGRLAAEVEELRQIVAAPVSVAGGPEFGQALVGKVRELVDERRHYAIAAKAVGRVRTLHQPMKRAGEPCCAHCSGWDGFRCRSLVTPWPCPTLAALDGSGQGFCELPHATIAEEDACDRQNAEQAEDDSKKEAAR